MKLSNLSNPTRPKKATKRVGRGLGSGLGKTSGRGEKGAGSRSGYKRRYGYEGGQFRQFMKYPIRGFSNAPFRVTYKAINLGQVEKLFEDGDVVNAASLVRKGFIKGRNIRFKLLGNGSLTKKVTIELDAISTSAKEKLTHNKIQFTQKNACARPN